MHSEASPFTFELDDRHGRLHQVVEPSGAGGALVTTTHGYEVGNRLPHSLHEGAASLPCHPQGGAASSQPPGTNSAGRPPTVPGPGWWDGTPAAATG